MTVACDIAFFSSFNGVGMSFRIIARVRLLQTGIYLYFIVYCCIIHWQKNMQILLFFYFLEAIRVKYRFSEDGYRRYYTNTLRVKLSRCLYDEGTRKENKKVPKKQEATRADTPVPMTFDDHDEYNDSEQ